MTLKLPLGRAILVAALFCAALPAFPPAATAAVAGAPQPGKDESATLDRVAAYLNGIHTMTARFQQIAANGGVATGSLWLQRPGRMRFQYDPPSPVLLIADRFYVYYIDRKLEEMQQVGLQSTPAWFLLRDHIRFGGGVRVTRFERGAGVLRVSLVEGKKPSLGTLTMVLSEHPLALRGWTIVDAEGKKTTVWIANPQFGMALDPKLFQYRSPFRNPHNSQ